MNIFNTFRSIIGLPGEPAPVATPPPPTAKPAATPAPARSPRRAVAARSGAQAYAGPPRQIPTDGTYYEALRTSGDRTPIPATQLAVRQVVRNMGRERLAYLGRWLYDNNGFVGLAVDTIANYSAPVAPQAASPNPDWNKLSDRYWADWCGRADYTGRFTLDTIQRLICKAVDVEGDIGVYLTEEAGFPQVQLVETWRIAEKGDNPEHVIDGVVTDAAGAVTGYLVQTDAKNAVRVPVGQMFLAYDPDFTTSYRGKSAIRRGSNDIRDVSDIKGFEKVAVKVSSALAAVIETETGIEEDVWGNDSGTEDGTITGDTQPPAEVGQHTAQEQKISVADLLAGMIPLMESGQKLHVLDNKRSGEDVIEICEYLVGCFAAGLGIPPAFFLDAKLTGPNQRAVNGKAQRRFDLRQKMLGALIEWLYPRVIAHAIDVGALPAQKGFELMEWQGPPGISIDVGRESQQEREDVFSGLMSRQNHYAKRSLSWKRETDQSLAEDRYIIAECAAIAELHKIDINILLARYGFDKAAPPKQGAPAPAPATPEKL